MRHEEKADGEDDDEQYDVVIPFSAYAVYIGRTYHLVEHKHGIVGDEEDHGMLAYVVDDGNAWHIDAKQYARETAQDKGYGEDGDIRVACPKVV